MSKKQSSSSYASWSLIMEGVSSARVEAYRLRHLLNRTMSLVEESVAKDHLYQVGGDIIMGFPERLHRLEQTLDRTSYALSKMGVSHLKERLPLSDREKVEEGIERAAPLSPFMRKASQRVAARYLFATRKDLLALFINSYKQGGKAQQVSLPYLKYWATKFENDLQPTEQHEGWIYKQMGREFSPISLPEKPNGYGGGKLLIGRGVSIVFTQHSVQRGVLRSVSAREAANAIRSFLITFSQGNADLTTREFYREHKAGISTGWQNGIKIKFTIPQNKLNMVGYNDLKLLDGARIIVETIIQNGVVERAGSLVPFLDKHFDPSLMGMASWSEMDWTTIRDLSSKPKKDNR